jgi:hypothetical protein
MKQKCVRMFKPAMLCLGKVLRQHQQIPLKQKKRKRALSLFVVTDLIIYHKEQIG